MDGINSGAEGFANIFGSGATQPDTQNESSQSGVAADESSPDEYSAEERVAANLADDLEADGYDVPEPGDAADDSEVDYSDLDSLTPEQLRELAKRALDNETQISETRRQEIARQVQYAEAQATEAVRGKYNTDVLGTSRPHYQGQMTQRVVTDLRRAIQQVDRDGGDLVAVVAPLIGRHFATVVDAMLAYEDGKAEEYEQYAEQARKQARNSVPDLRQAYAEALIAHYEVPKEAANDIMRKANGQHRSMDDFEDIAQKLSATRNTLVKQELTNQQEKRQIANTALTEQRIRPPTGAKPATRKAPKIKGDAEEGVAIMSLFKR